MDIGVVYTDIINSFTPILKSTPLVLGAVWACSTIMSRIGSFKGFACCTVIGCIHLGVYLLLNKSILIELKQAVGKNTKVESAGNNGPENEENSRLHR